MNTSLTKLLRSGRLILRRWVYRCQDRLNQLPARTLWIGSAAFILLASTAISCLLIVSWERSADYLSVGAIRVPAYVLQVSPSPLDSVRQAAWQHHLQHLLYQVDSLRTHPSTRPLYDSLVWQHPGLWDSLMQAQSSFIHPFTITP